MSQPIHQEVVFDATPKQIYEALMSAEQHSAFTGGAAEIERDVGGAFSCYGGQLQGRNVELVPDQRIVQAWRVAAWDDGVYSIVKFELRPEGDQTRLVMDHAGVPEPHREHIDGGWHARYWEPLRAYLQ
jgi:activator of HSP90 ATPase